MEVCPQIQCPMDSTIEEDCRKASYEIGTDGVTKCRMCDGSHCGKH